MRERSRPAKVLPSSPGVEGPVPCTPCDDVSICNSVARAGGGLKRLRRVSCQTAGAVRSSAELADPGGEFSCLVYFVRRYPMSSHDLDVTSTFFLHPNRSTGHGVTGIVSPRQMAFAVAATSLRRVRDRGRGSRYSGGGWCCYLLRLTPCLTVNHPETQDRFQRHFTPRHELAISAPNRAAHTSSSSLSRRRALP